MEKINNRRIREVDFWYRNTYIDIAKQKNTFCLLNSREYSYVESEEVIINSKESLIFQFANELYIEYELLDTETANLVFQIVLVTAKKFNCINNRVFGSLYHVFKPSSDIQWTEMINMMMNFENNIRNDFNKLNNSKPNDEEIIERLIKKEIENWENLELKKLNEMCRTLFGSNDIKAKILCSVIIDTFVLSFEMQNSLTSNYAKKSSSNETFKMSEMICYTYQKNTHDMKQFVEKYLIMEKMSNNSNIPSFVFDGTFCFRLLIFTIKNTMPINFPDLKNDILSKLSK